jgi:hypothetical protein
MSSAFVQCCVFVAADETRLTQESDELRQNQPEPILEHSRGTGPVQFHVARPRWPRRYVKRNKRESVQWETGEVTWPGLQGSDQTLQLGRRNCSKSGQVWVSGGFWKLCQIPATEVSRLHVEVSQFQCVVTGAVMTRSASRLRGHTEGEWIF